MTEDLRATSAAWPAGYPRRWEVTVAMPPGTRTLHSKTYQAVDAELGFVERKHEVFLDYAEMIHGSGYDIAMDAEIFIFTVPELDS